MRKHIGIVGAGTGGLHLGLYLRQHDIDVTLITDRRPDDYRSMRLLNTVAHHHVTIERETALGVNHWPDQNFGYFCHHHYFGEPFGLEFRGDFRLPSRAVDYRIYLPRLMEDFLERGGAIEYREISADDVPTLSQRFDLIVVGTGKGPLGQMFKHVPEFSPFVQPQRALCVGLYSGIAPTFPRGVTYSVSPGHGELIEIPTLTFDGMKTALLMENVPGGDLEEMAHLRYHENRRLFLDTLLHKLEKHHPTVLSRINTQDFDLAAPNDLLQGGVVPTVRRTHAAFENGKFAIAVGDVHSVVDPVVGQGANMASYAAWIMGEHIVRESVFDKRFCERVDLARQDRVLSASRWTNLMLSPPSEELGMLINEMSRNKRLCDEFTENFNFPERQWDRLASPARIRAWLDEYRANAPVTLSQAA
ncbi:styrene monooxygenase subunit StyA [Paraburkholderia domus]|uniref:styrene monooxygenase subunit StyA n=1 Tax=Paraburkholderia domus TaxID=2793075 RepID=UPI00191475D2|nr:styrene monooxygenase/indole monooxygenase family protein [Paraburkholderia domus]MBK5052281.1 monooxygenase [Burkholderia sp. R-70006]MBK5182116.1 monooxygenase [Burkholderia sp. R-69749]MCI0150050.1 hypothetical protein [Paraburkholderia sediminicola]CAE6806018.1 Styrene monooxygenase StyA [Paraburkholderia domus]CAE6841114.1 Styrene monooxygenase StyA [Paraburkholderia domus]